MNNKGFALIEVIISIVILAIVFGSAVSLLYSLSGAIEANRDRLTATYLTQECLESVRNARDTAWLNHQNWDCSWAGISSNCASKNILNNLKGEVQNSKFSRDFVITGVDETQQAIARNNKKHKITCTVKWDDDKKLSISQILTDWRKK